MGQGISGGTLGERLGMMRRLCGLTQEQLAEKAGLSISAVRKLEHGRRDGVRMATLTALAGALGVEAGELLGAGPGTWPAQAERDRAFGARIWELLAARDISPGQLEAILAGVPGPSGAVPTYRLLEFMTGALRALRAGVRALTQPTEGRI